MELVLLGIVVSAGLGWLGRHSTFGFWGTFFCSLALTPLAGLLVVVASWRGWRG